MNLILTGSKGNLGSEIISQNTTYEILPISRDNWSDLDRWSFSKKDVVIHTASDLKSPIHKTPFSVMDSNLVSTARLLEISKGCSLFVFISSCAVYGDALTTTENTRCRPLSINGITKLLNERIVEEFCSKNAIPYLILRVFNSYGGQDRFSIISKLQHSIKTGDSFLLNNFGIAQRDFIHVSDVADIVLKLSSLEIPNGYYNIGTGTVTKISDIVTMAKEQYPKLKIVDKSENEVEYSRADILKLKQVVECHFLNINQQLPVLFKHML